MPRLVWWFLDGRLWITENTKTLYSSQNQHFFTLYPVQIEQGKNGDRPTLSYSRSVLQKHEGTGGKRCDARP